MESNLGNDYLSNLENRLVRIQNIVNTIKLNQGVILEGLTVLMERDIQIHRQLIRDYTNPHYRPRRNGFFHGRPVNSSYTYIPRERIRPPTPPQQTPPPSFNNTRLNSNPATIELSFMTPRDNNLQSIFNTLLSDVNLNRETVNENTPLTFQEITNNTEIVTLSNETDNNNEEEIMCSICRGNIEQNEPLRKLKNCNHFFHINCIDNWLVNNSSCPICRQSVRINSTQI